MEDLIKNWRTQINKGFFPFIILKAIAKKRQYGYSLLVTINDETGLEVSEGTIYPILVRLNEVGLVSAKWTEQKSGMPRKYYEVSDEGRKAIETMEEMLTNYFKTLKQ